MNTTSSIPNSVVVLGRHGGVTKPLATSHTGLSNSNDATDAEVSQQEQVAYFEEILGFSYRTLKASHLTVRQQGDGDSANILVQVRTITGDSEREPSLVFEGLLSSKSSKQTATADQDLNTVTAPTNTTTASQEYVALSKSHRTLKDNHVTWQSAPTAPDQRQPAERCEPAPGLKRKAPDPPAYHKKKPRYRTWCMKESNNGCNRAKCGLMHEDQMEYFAGHEYITDKYPWRKDTPRIESCSDLEYAPGDPNKPAFRKPFVRQKRRFLHPT